MTKDNFLKQLDQKLTKLPPEEKQDAIEYYRQYFEDSTEDESTTATKLGSPSQLAKQITANLKLDEAVETSVTNPRKGISAVWAVILAIFAAPLALPILIALFAVIFSIIVAVFAVIISFFATSIALIIAGIVTFVLSFVFLFVHFLSGLALMGCALVCLGIGSIILYCTIKLNMLCISGLIKLAKRILNKNKLEA